MAVPSSGTPGIIEPLKLIETIPQDEHQLNLFASKATATIPVSALPAFLPVREATPHPQVFALPKICLNPCATSCDVSVQC